MTWWWLLVPVSYVLGTFPTANIVAGFVGHDPTIEGSGNPGASNVYRVAGARAGAIVLIGDLLKGFVPAIICFFIEGRLLGLVAGLVAMLGHIFPVTRKMSGGKGVATLGGVGIALYPLVAIVAVCIWIPIMKLFRRASIGSLSLIAIFPFGVLISSGGSWKEFGISAGASLIVLSRHSENIGRLLRGEEQSID
ncbi:MAG: glycerol-3-phosphate acyltransferase [Acidimicrobiales bacterium]|nr:glycerol-3-phosphate acyltransferase [Acidimicrobiales bacterium]MDP6298983.1 glycerol-3-phosphate acyltransferase [Acidimicrobiales bacterium]HJM28495.1 glycerol-3-phosphate acyltransferase [Acidimicrobiales bacterium]